MQRLPAVLRFGRGKQCVDRWMLTGFTAAIQIGHTVVRPDDHCPSLLEGITLQPTGAMACTQGGKALLQRAQPEQSTQAPFEPQHRKGFARTVGQQGSLIAGGLPDLLQMFSQTGTDHYQVKTSLFELLDSPCQFSNLLTAEKSAEMTDKDQNRRLFPPCITKRKGLAVLISYPAIPQLLRHPVPVLHRHSSFC